MAFAIRMGIPEMAELWESLRRGYRTGAASKWEQQLYRKWGKTLRLLSQDPRHLSLRTHDIDPLSNRYVMRVWQSYLENGNSRAMRMY